MAFGENSLDTLVVAAPIGSEGKQSARIIVECAGGQTATAAVACANLGWRVRYAGFIGDDPAAEMVSRSFAVDRLDPVLVRRAGVATRRAVILVDEANGHRHVIEHRESGLDAEPGEFPDTLFADARILLVDATDMTQSIRAARAARLAGVRTIVDVDRPRAGLTELLTQIDLVVIPDRAVGEITGESALLVGLGALGAKTGAAAVIATCGPDGAVAWCQGQVIRSPAAKVSVVDTTGAGDAFRAGLAAGWLGREGVDVDLADLLADANLVAALNCRALGAQTSLPQALEVPRHLRGPV